MSSSAPEELSSILNCVGIGLRLPTFPVYVSQAYGREVEAKDARDKKENTFMLYLVLFWSNN